VSEIKLLDYGTRDEWLASRKLNLGASEVAALFTDEDGNSMSPYTTATKLYLEKTGQVEPEELSKEYVEMGNRFEPVIADIYVERTGRKIWQPPSPFSVAMHNTVKGFRATPDRWVLEAPDREGSGLVQIKNANAFSVGEWREGPPQHIEIQVQAEMSVTGRDWDSVAVMIGGNTFKSFDVERNEDFIRELEEQVKWFWARVAAFEPPPIDGSVKTLEAIRRLHPSDNGETVQLPEEAVAWLDTLESAKNQAKALEALEIAAKSKLMAAIGDATFGELPDGRMLSLKTTETQDRVQTVKGSKYRTLRVVGKKPKGKKVPVALPEPVKPRATIRKVNLTTKGQ
jgi:putative phage-type endonuclease